MIFSENRYPLSGSCTGWYYRPGTSSLRPRVALRVKREPVILDASPINTRCLMTEVIYEVVEHDGGWAYKVDGVFSEPYPTHAAALRAARAAAAEQRVPGHSEVIEYEDAKGKWHTESAAGMDRPNTAVKDSKA
jgi:hypothetical protein